MPAENVKVAVRVRPFNDREKKMNARLCIDMSGQTTEIKSETGESKKFAFDYSYWSHDGFKTLPNGYFEPTSARYADQKKVFEDLGRGVLANAWAGYNCSLFAYGQTGSGKSYSMVGYSTNKGIVPVACEELFKAIDEKRKTQVEGDDYQVSLSMLEIYNEKVRDLLTTKVTSGGLKVRQHPTKGFYVEELTTAPVSSYSAIDAKINEGTRNRTVASTNMNATSSRAHTIVAINFSQKSKSSGQSMTKTSVMNLVDLAGSERASSTGATGDRLKEGSAINQSLSSLGNVISALASASSGGSNVQVPFRDSVLTKLLKNALGGNSKTIMIAALSPADVNYEETLSTLRFADRAKAIKTTAIINESPTDKLIRELKEENQRLMDLLKGGGALPKSGPDGDDAATQEELKRVMEKNAREMEEMQRSYEERLKAMTSSTAKGEADSAEKQKRLASEPHMWNLNEDESLTNMVQKFCPNGKILIGNGKEKGEDAGAIVFQGGGMRPKHAWVNNNKGKVTLTPIDKSPVKVNGKTITQETLLHHGDRLLFGEGKHLYVFHHPVDYAKNLKAGKEVAPMNFDSAMEEIAEKQGSLIKPAGKDLSKEEQLLREELIKKLPMVNQANSMSEELQKGVKFDIAPVSAQARGLASGPTIIRVKVKNEVNGLEFIWDWDKFDNRYFMMQSMYENFMEGSKDWDVPQEKDPFWDPPDQEVEIGCAHLYLQSLAYMMDTRETLKVLNYQGLEVGELDVNVAPCDDAGDVINDSYVDDPSELINKPYKISLYIEGGKKFSERFQKIFCRYSFFVEKEAATNECAANGSVQILHKRVFSYPKVTKQMIDFFNENVLVFTVFGRQRAAGPTKASAAPAPQGKTAAKPAAQATDSKGDSAVLKSELEMQRKKTTRMEKKIQKIQSLVNDARKKQEATISIDVLDRILASNTDRLTSAVAPSAKTSQIDKAMEERLGTQASKACVTM